MHMNNKKISSIIFVAAVIFIFAMMVKSYIVGTQIDIYEFDATSLSGEKLQKEQLENKVVVLNLWATWCKPCVQEMPIIDELYQSIDPNLIQFVLATDDSQGKAITFSEKHQLSAPIYLSEKKFKELSVQTIPVTIIYDKKGKAVERKLGAFESTDELRNLILPYL